MLAILFALVCVPPHEAIGAAATSGQPEQTRHVRCGDRSYEYTLFSPDAHAPLAALMLLHGAGGKGSDMVDVWKSLALREHVVLIAPQLPRELWFEQAAPSVFRCVVADAERVVSIDAHRVYLFGYSMGGYLAFDGAMFDSDVFAAAGVYAAAINQDYDSIVDSAQRKIPIAMYIGDRDQYFSLAQTRRTRALLESHGFPVRYTELPGQDHAYAPVSDRVNDDAWTYLSGFRLAL
jgi:poly(3-hydroxybutyrate) depolymerase